MRGLDDLNAHFPLYSEHLLAVLSRLSGAPRCLQVAPLIGALTIARKTNPAAIDKLLDKLMHLTKFPHGSYSVSGIGKRDPAYRLYDYILKDERSKHHTGSDLALRALRSAMAEVESEEFQNYSPESMARSFDFFRSAWNSPAIRQLCNPHMPQAARFK
jgi:hypothetical protein